MTDKEEDNTLTESNRKGITALRCFKLRVPTKNMLDLFIFSETGKKIICEQNVELYC